MDRGQWLDVLIALIEYLRSGESKVGFLNKAMERNMLNKGVEDEMADSGKKGNGENIGEIQREELGVTAESEETPRRSLRKRRVGNVELEERDAKVRRKR